MPGKRILTIPSQTHRILSALSAVSLIVGTRALWNSAIANRPVLGLVLTLAYGVILLAGILAFVVKSNRRIMLLDGVILLTGLAILTCGWLMHHSGTDEGNLTAYAAKAFLEGKPVYGVEWKSLFTQLHLGVTKTMNGGADYTYGYPPVGVYLTAVVYMIHHSTAAATFVTTMALFVITIAAWFFARPKWRPVVVIVAFLGLNLIRGASESGYPALLACLFMVPVVAYWSKTGLNGRLRWSGYLQAIALGLACGSQQLAWFTLPFLAVGLFALRKSEIGTGRALLLLLRYFGVALAVFLLASAYFIIKQPKAWLDSLLMLLNQHAILHGQGIMGISYYDMRGSGALDFYSHASILVLAGLVLIAFLFIRRIGPALFVLPWIAFWFATRSQEGYYTLMMPLWFIAATTVSLRAFRNAWQPRFTLKIGSFLKGLITVVIFLPTAASLAVAIFTPAPLNVSVSHLSLNATHKILLEADLKITNTSKKPLSPNFAYREGEGAGDYFKILEGPKTLAPGQSATYEIQPANSTGQKISQNVLTKPHIVIVSDSPMTITTVTLTKPKAVKVKEG